jgi:hypothetical protein
MINDIAELHPSIHISNDDLLGKSQTVTIESIEKGEAKGIDGKKTIIRFVGIPKALVSNPTNDYAIAVLLGRKPNEWVGKKIVLSPASSTFGASVVPCVRVTDSPDATQERRKALAAIRAACPDTKTVELARLLKLKLFEIDPPTAKGNGK